MLCFHNLLKILILWSTAEAVLRPINFLVSMFCLLILWSTAEAVLRHDFWSLFSGNNDPMVYCGSGTETCEVSSFFHNWILWSTAEAVLRRHNSKIKKINIRSYGLLRKRY